MDKNRVDVKEIVKEYLSLGKLEANHNIPSLKVKHYIPISEKLKAIHSVLDVLCKQSESYTVTYSSIEVHYGFFLAVIELYTNITYKADDSYGALDTLLEYGLMDVILDEIGKDVDEFKKMYDMKLGDIVRDSNSIEAIVSRELRYFNEGLQELMIKSASEIDSTALMKELIEKANSQK